MKLDDFKPGDLLEIDSRNRNGIETRAAQVTCVNYNGNGLVTFEGDWSRPGLMATGQGAFDPAKVGAKQFGLVVAVRKIGYKTPWHASRWTPKPGDRGYDLLH